MIHTFGTREEAAIFAATMRSEGYFAEILDEGMGAIYGPLAIGGIRVLVSEQPIATEPDDALQESTDRPLHEPASGDGEFRQTVRFFTVGLVAFGLIALALFILAGTRNSPESIVRLLTPVLKYLLVLGLAFAVLGPLMGGFTRWLRGESTSAATGCLRWLLLVVITGFVLLMML